MAPILVPGPMDVSPHMSPTFAGRIKSRLLRWGRTLGDHKGPYKGVAGGSEADEAMLLAVKMEEGAKYAAPLEAGKGWNILSGASGRTSSVIPILLQQLQETYTD